MRGKLENLLFDVEKYRKIEQSHSTVPSDEMDPCLNMYQDEIISTYQLKDGEFKKVYEYVRNMERFNGGLHY